MTRPWPKRITVAIELILAAGMASCNRRPLHDFKMPEWQREISRPVDQWLSEPSIKLLQEYVQIDTTDPPGHERRGAEFLKAYLDCEGIDSRLICPEKDRCNLYSRLPGRDHARAILLLNHIDVVPVFPPGWTKPTFGGVIDSGYLYGRGSYDMKSIAIAQLLAYVDLFHSGIPLDRDVVFLAECGEEVDGRDGVPWLFEHERKLFDGVNLVLNEGGYEEVVAGELLNWGIETGQGGEAHCILASDDKERVTFSPLFQDFGLDIAPAPPVRDSMMQIAEFRGGYHGNALRHPEIFRDPHYRPNLPIQIVSLLMGGALYSEPFESRLVPTLDIGKKWNSIVTLSLPLGIDPKPYLDNVISRARQRGAVAGQIQINHAGLASPFPTSDTRLLARALNALHPGVPVIPIVNAFSATTSAEFRSHGIPAYGFTPFQVDPFDAARRHGNDERVFLPFYSRGITVMREALFELATNPSH